MKRLAIASACILLLLAAAVLWVARSEWLREQIRAAIVTQAETATGGRVELGAFHFDWPTLTAECDRFVIHGTEPPGEAPLLQIDRLVVGLRIISFIRRDVSLERIEADRPQTHLIIYPGGKTNLPQPKVKPRGSLPQTILDLKIARFDLLDGLVLLDGQPPKPWSAQGRNLAAHVTYDAAGARYAGDIAIEPLRLLSTDWQVAASAAMERNRVLIPHAVLKSAASEIDLENAALTDFNAPVVTARYNARISLAEAGTLLQLKTKQAGSVTAAGDARYVSLADYRVTGTAGGSGIDFDRLRNIRATAAFDAAPGRISFTDIRANVLGGEVTAVAEIRDFDTFRATGRLARFDLRQVAALDTSKQLPYDGVVSGPFQATGQIHDMSRPLVTVTTQATISPAATGAPVHGEVALHYDASAQRIDLGHSWLELPNTRLEVAGTLGQRLDVKLHSQDFAELAPAVDMVTAGRPIPALKYESLDFDGRVTGPLANPLIAGKASARNLDYQGTQVESAAGDITASASGATVSGGSLVAAGIHARGAGSLGLSEWQTSASSSLTASVQIADADLTKILALAGHKEIDLKGSVSGSAQITGTLGDPQGNGDLAVTRGSIYEQPFDSITAHAQFLNRTTQALTGLFVSGPKRVNISARFEHAGTRFPAGKLAFNLTSNTMPLNQIALVRARQPDIHGFGEFHADGELQLNNDAKHNLQFDLLSLNATASANSVELGGRNLGDLRASAQTRDGMLTARFDSNAAKASIHGEGTMGLTGDYPVNGKLTFSDAGLNALAALVVTENEAAGLNFDGSGEGTVTVTGSAKKPDQLSAAIEVQKLELHPLPNSDFARSLPNFVAANSGPVRAVATKSQIRIESAHFTAPQTDVLIDGSVAFTGQSPLNLRVQGTVNLALARTISPDITSSGSLALNATMRGDWKTPDFSGRASIRGADIHFADFSNGLTNANGDFVFGGTHATIQSFTAESGGGKVDAGGFVALTNGMLAFRIEARAHEVRVRYPEGVSSISDATLTFAGSSQRSEASGVVTVHRIAINPRFDTANILASSAEPLRAPSGRAGLMANLNLDIQISTAPDAAFETSVTQSLQADANLRLRGTATNPALIGRINVTQGEVIFFGSKYSINGGTISFFDPVRIDPVLNLDLETKARGVDVILTITGSATRPLNVSFRSDPPLQYSDILALLATGRTPSDPTLAVRGSSQGQNFQQLGASTLIGQALANPASSRLQRFFGVSRLKIDPQLTGVTGSPEARLTIEQQVTPDILFTYITDVSSTSTQLFRAEWSFNRRWSAILIRDENGYVGLDFAYKKRFK